MTDSNETMNERLTEKWRRFLDWTLIAVFAVMVSVPMLTTPWARQLESGGEKRQLSPWPPLPRDAQAMLAYPRRVEAWVQDHFGLRDSLVRTYSRLCYHVFRTSSSPKVLLGRDAWLFYHGDRLDGRPIEDYRGTQPLSLRQLEWIRWMLQDQYEWLRDHRTDYLFVLIPSKEEVYGEYLPPYITRAGPRNTRRQVVEYVQSHTRVPVLDLSAALEAARTHRLCFCRTDTHWTDYGAFVAYREIMNRVAQGFPAAEPLPESAFCFQRGTENGGDLAAMLNMRTDLREEVEHMTPVLPARGKPREAGHKEMADIIAGTGDPASPSAVVYRDSFAEILIPFLSEHFREIRYVWARLGANMNGVAAAPPDVVLQIMSDRALRLNLRYSPEIQMYCTQRRFAASTARLSGSDQLTPLGDTKVSHENDALHLSSLSEAPEVELPTLKDMDKVLPIIRIDVTLEEDAEIALSVAGDSVSCQGAGKGRREIILALYDPEQSGPLRFRFGSRPGHVLLHSLEIRGWPR